MKSESGFSTIELLVSAFIFLMVFGVGVWAVSRTFGLHSEASVRQGLQRDIQAVAAFMEEDGSRTNFFRTANAPVTLPSTGERRDSLAMVGLSSWQGSIPLDSLGLPAWNNVIAYRTTTDPAGELVREVVRPGIVPIQDNQVLPILNDLLAGGPGAGDTLISKKVLSKSVADFSVEVQSGFGLIVCELKLRQKVAQADGMGAKNESLDVRIMLFPQNTWPVTQ